ncbi:MAG: RNA-binding protein [Elusimicrobiota bacterium]|jgi:RNA recognition motif-containing protein
MVKRLFVGGLSYETTEDELTELFSTCGGVSSVKLIMDGDRGRSKGFGFVDMASEGEARAALAKLNGFSLSGRIIAVSEARPQEPRALAPRPQAEPARNAPGKPDFVERRSGLKDRRRSQSSGGPAEKRPGAGAWSQGGKRGGDKDFRKGFGGAKKPWRGKPGGFSRGGPRGGKRASGSKRTGGGKRFGQRGR